MRGLRPVLGLAVGIVLLAGGLVYLGSRRSAVPPPTALVPPLPTVRVEIAVPQAPLRFQAEVAGTMEDIENLLQYPPSGAEAEVFRFPEPVEYAFALKASPAPLTLAFFDEDGIILKLWSRLPCLQSCPGYDPGGPFQGVLVDPGDRLERAGVREGQTLRLKVLGDTH